MSEQLDSLRSRIVGSIVDEVYGGAIEDADPIHETVDIVFKELLRSTTPASDSVLGERRRQVETEGWTPEHDDEHPLGEMAAAAACYAIHASKYCTSALETKSLPWPWALEWWKPTTPRRDLVKAGALILAEIERLDRLEARND